MVNQHSCFSCDNAIVNPICATCLSRQMQLTLGEDLFDCLIEGEGGVNCLFCQNPMSLCASCYSKDMYEILQIKNPALGKEFLKHFDFGVRKSII